jgi:hypothetical protein
MSTFPGAIPSYSTMSPNATLSAAGHTSRHNEVQLDLIALATKLGTGSATPASGKVLKGNGAGSSTWGAVDLTTDVTGILPVGSGGTGTNSTTGSGSVVYGTAPTITSPIITTPTIASFTNAQHDHSNAAGGGSLGTNAVSAAALATNAIELGYTAITSSSSAITAEADVAGLACTVTVPAGGRDVKITVMLPEVTTSANGQRAAILIKEGSTYIARTYKYLPSTLGGNGLTYVARVAAPSAGAHTYKVAAICDVGAGSIGVFASAVPDQASMLVELM